jgi:hypothetical protein
VQQNDEPVTLEIDQTGSKTPCEKGPVPRPFGIGISEKKDGDKPQEEKQPKARREEKVVCGYREGIQYRIESIDIPVFSLGTLPKKDGDVSERETPPQVGESFSFEYLSSFFGKETYCFLIGRQERLKSGGLRIHNLVRYFSEAQFKEALSGLTTSLDVGFAKRRILSHRVAIDKIRKDYGI